MNKIFLSIDKSSTPEVHHDSDESDREEEAVPVDNFNP
jgi:CheY-like chemotaxis protein